YDLTLDFIGSGNLQIAAEFLLSHFKTRGQGDLAIVDQVDLLPHIDKSIFAVQPVGDISGLAVHHPSHVGDSVEHRIASLLWFVALAMVGASCPSRVVRSCSARFSR